MSLSQIRRTGLFAAFLALAWSALAAPPAPLLPLPVDFAGGTNTPASARTDSSSRSSGPVRSAWRSALPRREEDGVAGTDVPAGFIKLFSLPTRAEAQQRAVAAAVVDEDQLPGALPRRRRHGRRHSAVELLERGQAVDATAALTGTAPRASSADARR